MSYAVYVCIMPTTNEHISDRVLTSTVAFSIGDVCPEDHGGGAVVFTPGEGFVLEYTHGLEVEHPKSSSMLEGLDELKLDLYRVQLDEPFYRMIGNSDKDIWRKLGDCVGMHKDEVLEMAKSCKIQAICGINEIYAAYYGWRELDYYPIQVTYKDLTDRWAE